MIYKILLSNFNIIHITQMIYESMTIQKKMLDDLEKRTEVKHSKFNQAINLIFQIVPTCKSHPKNQTGTYVKNYIT